MKMNSLLPLPQPLKFENCTEVGRTWKRFKQSWKQYELASGTIEKDEQIRVATFLHVAGDEALQKYEGFLWENSDDKLKIQKVIEKFDEDYEEKTNEIIERNKFLSRKQNTKESCDQFATALRSLIISCNYENAQAVLRDQFLIQLSDKKLKEKLLEEAQRNSKLSFQQALNMAKQFEITEQRKQTSCEDTVLMIRHKDKREHERKQNCSRCCGKHEPRRCPAYGKVCHTCKKLNHFAKVCKQTKNLNYLQKVNNEQISDNSNNLSEDDL